MKKSYKVEVDCANCAAKMQDAVSKLEGVNEVTVNFMTQKLIINYADNADVDSVLKAAVEACKKVEPDFEIEL